MEEIGIINALAMTLGAGAVVGTAIPAIFRSFRAWRGDPQAHQLEIHVRDHIFVLDPTSLNLKNDQEIQGAIEAIREANREEA